MPLADPSDRWGYSLVHERWQSFTPDEQEALMRFGSKQAPWESVPDTALRILKCDPKIELHHVKMLDAIFRVVYNETVAVVAGRRAAVGGGTPVEEK